MIQSREIVFTGKKKFFFYFFSNACHELNFQYFSIKFFLYTLESVLFNIDHYRMNLLLPYRQKKVLKKKRIPGCTAPFSYTIFISYDGKVLFLSFLTFWYFFKSRYGDFKFFKKPRSKNESKQTLKGHKPTSVSLKKVNKG